MNKLGFLRSAAIVPVVKVACTQTNAERICELIDKAVEKEVAFAVFPELCITGYTCGDLFFQRHLLDQSEAAVLYVIEHTKGLPVTVAIGAPVEVEGRLYNCAIVINNGKVLGIVPKCYLPNYLEFYEARWFHSGFDLLGTEGQLPTINYAGQNTTISPNLLFEVDGVKVGIEVCEDVWAPIPRSTYLTLAGAEVVGNLSASNEVLNKSEYRKQMISLQSGQRIIGYIFSSCGYGESTSGVVFGGSSGIYERGQLLSKGESFKMEPQIAVADIDIDELRHRRMMVNTFDDVSPDGHPMAHLRRCFNTVKADLNPVTDFSAELHRPVNPAPFVPQESELDHSCRNAFEIQATALASRLESINCKKVVIGISGGLDSTLAVLASVMAFDKLGLDRKGIIGITMPGFGTSDRTHNNASNLMDALGITSREISIKNACIEHFANIGHDGQTTDIAYENAQARERTQILMDVANMEGALVIGTGDLSEIALGWCTYNGDQMSNYAVNASIPKTLIRVMVGWAADNGIFGEGVISDTLRDIVATPVSPELKAAQVTEDVVGPYELHDFFLYNMVHHGFSPEKVLFMALKAFDGVYDEATIRKWLKMFLGRFFAAQFKRSASPDGPKVCVLSLDPRGDWRMPSDVSGSMWKDSI